MDCRVLVEGTDEMSEQKWLQYRNQGIGSSDIGKVANLNPWSSPLAVYHEKRGDTEPFKGNLNTHIGSKMEDVLAEFFHDICVEGEGLGEVDLGDEVPELEGRIERRNAILQHKDRDYMICNVDRLLVNGKQYPVELKNTNPNMKSFWYEGGDPIAPAWMELQVMHQLVVMGVDRGFLWGYFGGQDFELRVLERDQEYTDLIMEMEDQFWERVRKGVPPPLDGSQATTDLLEKMYDDPHEIVKRIENEKAQELIRRYDSLKEENDELEEEIDTIKNQMRDEIGKHEKALVLMPDGNERTVLWQPRQRVYPKLDAIRDEHPELFVSSEEALDYPDRDPGDLKPDYSKLSESRVFQIY